MQEFVYTVKYKPGSVNIADALSRFICRDNQQGRRIENVAEEYVRFVAQTATPKGMTTREVKEHSHQDKEVTETTKKHFNIFQYEENYVPRAK